MEEILKLERLRFPTNPTSEHIFSEIERMTGADIRWKAGCRALPNRKDPSIQITGTEENVQDAKHLVLDRMEIICNRVSLKMDISHFEHPSLIGRGGKLNQTVMQETNCHVHYPDSNKVEGAEKNNQVAIDGDPISVERARVMLRALIPVQVFFKLPFSLISWMPLNKEVELWNYKSLCVYLTPCNNDLVVVVRCSQEQFPDEKKEISHLMEILFHSNGANLPPVQMVTAVSQKHQVYIKSNSVEGMMKRTGAKIIFPDINISSSDRNIVTIVGSLDCVYMAWQEIMNHLPITISFDINITRDTKGEYLNFLRDCGIKEYEFQKEKHFIKTVSIKGCEKYSHQMIQYRQHLLRQKSLSFTPDVDAINLAFKFMTKFVPVFHSPIPTAVLNILSKCSSNDVSKYDVQYIESECSNWVNSCFILRKQLLVQDSFFQNLKLQNLKMDNCWQSQNICAQQTVKHDWFSAPYSSPCVISSLQKETKNLKNEAFLNQNVNYKFIKKMADPVPQQTYLWKKNGSLFPNDDFDYYHKKALAAKAMRRPIESAAQAPCGLWSGFGFSESMPASVIKRNMEASTQASFQVFDNGSDLSNEREDVEKLLKECMDKNIWCSKKEPFSHSNYFELLRNSKMPSDYYSSTNALAKILYEHGLYMYIGEFTKQEVDYSIFIDLTDDDLATLNIPSAARVKLMCIIKELQEIERTKKKFDAAPGSQRK